MPEAVTSEVSIYYETHGDAGGVPLLLINGLGGQLTGWDPNFHAELVARGFFLICFDNRDAGRSTWFDHAGPGDPLAALAGQATPAYLLSDMADDAVVVLDALGVASAHVIGVSMGGMIAQTLTIEHPDRVRSLISVMSTTGDPAVGQARPEVVGLLMRPPAPDKSSAIETGVAASRAISSPGFAFDEERVRARIARDYDRGYHPEGTARQLVAIICSGDRTEQLRKSDVATLVVHGADDPLVAVSGGYATAEAVPGAVLKVIPGMGHDLPPALFVELADAVSTHALSAEARS
jgi:pimeloyl-ACP methyl ester carboxylesterase